MRARVHRRHVRRVGAFLALASAFWLGVQLYQLAVTGEASLLFLGSAAGNIAIGEWLRRSPFGAPEPD